MMVLFSTFVFANTSSETRPSEMFMMKKMRWKRHTDGQVATASKVTVVPKWQMDDGHLKSLRVRDHIVQTASRPAPFTLTCRRPAYSLEPLSFHKVDWLFVWLLISLPDFACMISQWKRELWWVHSPIGNDFESLNIQTKTDDDRLMVQPPTSISKFKNDNSDHPSTT